MSNVSPVVAKPTPGLTPEQARDIRARALRYALDCHIRKQQTTGSSSEKTTVTERGGQHDLTDDSPRSRRQDKRRKEKKMPTYTATDYEPVPPGLYTAKLEKIEEATSQHGIYYRWQFVIEDEGDYEGRSVYANVSHKFGPQSKARRWCEQMVGRAIRKGEQFDTDALLGQPYHIMVSNTPEDERGRVYDQVENVHKVRPKEKPKPQETEEPDDPDEDFDNIPW